MSVQQIETATIVGSIINPGNAKITVTSARMSNSPKVVSVAVSGGNTASDVGLAARIALAFDADVSATFLISGAGANIILTAHVASANDTTLNIASDNDTCTGLTAEPTSTHTLAGSGLSNCYISLQQFLDYQRISSTDAVDDNQIADDITAACRWIDRETLTNFYGKTETHLFNVPLNFGSNITDIPKLELDDWLISVTTLTNGDGTVIPTADYFLLPANRTPKYSLGLRPALGVSWQPAATGDNVQVVSLAGVWGFATSAPEDIQAATMEIVAALYSRRFGTNMVMKTITTPAGIIQVPEGVPDWAAQVIGNYRKVFT